MKMVLMCKFSIPILYKSEEAMTTLQLLFEILLCLRQPQELIHSQKRKQQMLLQLHHKYQKELTKQNSPKMLLLPAKV